MPPLTRRELRKLVRKLGVVTRPREQQAMLVVVQLINDGNEDNIAAIVEAGVIPAVVQLMGPGSPVASQEASIAALAFLAESLGLQLLHSRAQQEH
ncbi:hypothetical protein FOA52_003923 [Chlamydomonas sp. UWO 241]|nr:hypothetical protein FOA52_003923 [Chlamydomonas sp. UWO 241]